MKTLTFALPALLALAACDSGAQDTAAPTAPAVTATPTPSPTASTIPAAIQGRWGLVAADCEPGRDDAKGLLTIGTAKLEFYESVGTLSKIADADDSHVRAVFDFTGEGMTWERDELLEVQPGGRALSRREYGQDAAPEPFRYTRCE